MAATLEPFGLVALDGADDDGGTLYVLLDGGQPVKEASWPHPLETYAAELGRDVVRLPAIGGQLAEHTSITREATTVGILEDLSPSARLNGHQEPGCKTPGCSNLAAARMGPYARLCEPCKRAKVAAGFKPGKPAAARVTPPTPPVEPPARGYDDHDDGEHQVVTLAVASKALADTVALCEELKRQLAEERENLGRIVQDVERLLAEEL